MIVDLDLFPGATESPPSSGKFILNEDAVIFFSNSQQHREVKRHGLNYEDDYRGNAVAGTFIPGRIDIRFHESFSDDRIRALWQRCLTEPCLSFLRNLKPYYQGRSLT